VIDAYEIVFQDYGWDWNTIQYTPIPQFFEILKARTRRLNREKESLKK